MALGDALMISLLGLAVVFGGLSLTALLVFAVARLPRLAAWLGARRRLVPAVNGAEERPPVEPAVVAVIAAALEVERRLHHAELGRRLTIEPRS